MIAYSPTGPLMILARAAPEARTAEEDSAEPTPEETIEAMKRAFGLDGAQGAAAASPHDTVLPAQIAEDVRAERERCTQLAEHIGCHLRAEVPAEADLLRIVQEHVAAIREGVPAPDMGELDAKDNALCVMAFFLGQAEANAEYWYQNGNAGQAEW